MRLKIGRGHGNDICVKLVKLLYGVVLVFGILLALVTLHGFKSVGDPVTPIGILDKLSFIMGVHDKQAVTVLHIDSWTTTVYTFVFHRHLNDRSFHLAEEKRNKILPGLFGSGGSKAVQRPTHNESLMDARIDKILQIAEEQQPPRRTGLFRLQQNEVVQKTPVVARVSSKVAKDASRAGGVTKRELGSAVRKLLTRLDASEKFQVNGDTGIGTIDDIADERALQWYAINLMTHKVQQQGPQWKPKDTAIIFDVGEESLNITLALPAPPRSVMRSSGGAGADKGVGLVNKGLGAGRADLVKHITSVRKMVAFGHPLQLATLTFEGVGLFTARRYLLTLPESLNSSGSSGVTTAVGGVDSLSVSAVPAVITPTPIPDDRPGAGKTKIFSARSACVNPIIDAYWQWHKDVYHIRGLEKGDHEMVKERNGPFAGKRINRPVANYKYCHSVMVEFVSKQIGHGVRSQLESLLKGRQVFMEGLLKEMCVGRGLSLPDKGGDVKAKALMDSLRHACRIPNTDQPLACTDMTFLTTLLDLTVGGLKPGSVIRSSRLVEGFTAEWPLGSAFYVYENGL